MKKMLNNKKGQLSDAMVWIIATVIVVVILFVFVYASNILGKANSIKKDSKELLVENSPEENINLFEEKTLLAYKINSANKNKIQEWINGS